MIKMNSLIFFEAEDLSFKDGVVPLSVPSPRFTSLRCGPTIGASLQVSVLRVERHLRNIKKIS